MKTFNIVMLSLSALALFYASFSRLIDPSRAVFLQTYLDNSGNNLDNHIDWVNEIRGVGAVMFLGGIIAILGAIKPGFRETAFVVVTVIFAGVVLGRSISFILDGVPNQGLIRVAIIEGVLAVLNIFCLAYILMKGNT
ncbi:MAG: DUF4345 domain-containing protein [Bacteroidota bacterium]